MESDKQKQEIAEYKGENILKGEGNRRNKSGKHPSTIEKRIKSRGESKKEKKNLSTRGNKILKDGEGNRRNKSRKYPSTG